MFSYISGFLSSSILRRRIVVTLLGLFFYRVSSYVVVPEVGFFSSLGLLGDGKNSGVLSFFTLFSGANLNRVGIFSLGILPYISASIMLQLATAVIPSLNKIQKEGSQGRQRIVEYTKYLALIIAIPQGLFILSGGGHNLVKNIYIVKFFCLLGFLVGTCVLIWVSDFLTEYGVTNGVSLIVFSSILARTPESVSQFLSFFKSGSFQLSSLLFSFIICFFILSVVITVEKAQRRIPINYSHHQSVIGSEQNFIPFKINSAGVIPPIFASSLMVIPSMMASFWPDNKILQNFWNNHFFLYNSLFFVLIFLFSFFYVSISSNPSDIADNIKKQGGYVLGLTPGRKTADFLSYVITRITFVGGLYIGLICVLPFLNVDRVGVPLYFGGTALLIVVGVVLDIMNSLEVLDKSSKSENILENRKKIL